MPSPAQIRKRRIEKLLNACQEALPKPVDRVDPIYWKARKLFPLVRHETCMDYAVTVYALLYRRQKEQGSTFLG